MAKVKPSIIEESGSIGNNVFYTRFGKSFSHRRPTRINDRRSEAQLRQRAPFRAMQHTASLLGSVIQRGLAREAHSNGHVENNEFASLNKQYFVYENGAVHIDYPRLFLSTGPIGRVDFTQCPVDDLHVELSFAPCMGVRHTSPDYVVHIYAVEFQAEICQLVDSISRKEGCVAFDLPDFSDDPDCKSSPTFFLYAIVEAANTACVPTLSPDEKRADKSYHNINRRVSPSVSIGSICLS